MILGRFPERFLLLKLSGRCRGVSVERGEASVKSSLYGLKRSLVIRQYPAQVGGEPPVPKARHAWKSYSTKAMSATDVVARAALEACPVLPEMEFARLLKLEDMVFMMESGTIRESI